MNTPQVWQVAAGSEGRKYGEIFLKFGIMAIGGSDSERSVQSFQRVKADDVVILREGKKVLAVGKVRAVGDQVLFIDQNRLGDFDGWSLPYYSNIEWHIPDRELTLRGRPSRFSQFHARDSTYNSILEILQNESYRRKPAYDLSAYDATRISDERLITHLMRNGLRALDAENLANAFRRIRRLANLYAEFGSHGVLEHETRTFLVIPLLVALGWSEQQIKIEQNHVDISVFDRPFSSNHNEAVDPKVLIETKKFHYGLDEVENQAKEYVRQYPGCNKIITTNGTHYKLFYREPNVKDADWNLGAFMSIQNLLEKYPLYPEAYGSLQVFEELMPRP
jgi:hypothetical protein